MITGSNLSPSTRRVAARLLIALASVALLAGLSASAALAAPPDTKQMVLRLADVPAGFSLAKGYYADNARAAKESDNVSLADYTRWGRITGYEADFSRDGLTGILTGPSSLHRQERRIGSCLTGVGARLLRSQPWRPKIPSSSVLSQVKTQQLADELQARREATA